MSVWIVVIAVWIVLGLVWVGGVLYEGCRRGGTLDLEQRVAVLRAERNQVLIERALLQASIDSTPLRHLIPPQERRR